MVMVLAVPDNMVIAKVVYIILWVRVGLGLGQLWLILLLGFVDRVFAPLVVR